MTSHVLIVQAAGLLPMQAQPLKMSLHPLPVREILLLGERRDLRIPLSMALECAGIDEVDGSATVCTSAFAFLTMRLRD
ncbi:hypothetical protein AU476_38210 [Cupriavidus sp. UYMSc13B]|nr:hypothetical protein AU476_38210 [Cupriavidus sp. UYMSc13B]